MVLIAAANLFFVVHFTIQRRKHDVEKIEKNRRVSMLKTLIIDYKFKTCLEIIDKMESIVEDKTFYKDMRHRINLNEQLGDSFNDLRFKFVDLLLAIDHSLYSEIMNKCDCVRDILSEALCDEGLNLQYPPLQRNKICKPINTLQTEIMHSLFLYKG